MRYKKEKTAENPESAVYLTTYRGNKMPPFYIGSSYVHRLNDGYSGTVSSKLYRDIWRSELKTNRHLFHTRIICRGLTRLQALEKEADLQISLNVIVNPLYINMATATLKFVKTGTCSAETRAKLSKATLKQLTPERRRRIGEQAKIRNRRIWTLVSPSSETLKITDLKSFSKTNNLNITSLQRSFKTSKPISKGLGVGWQLIGIQKWT